MKLTKLQARIKATNEAFEKLSPAEKRVAIARDVIAQLESGKFHAKTGVYGDFGRNVTQNDLKKDASEVFTQAESCTVCGIGGLFVSAVCKADNLPMTKLNLDQYDTLAFSGAKAYAYLAKFFPRKTLKNIETAFEKHNNFGGEWEASIFAEDVYDSNDRLRLIMENIIVNKGRFNYNQRPQQVTKWVTEGFRG